MQWEPQGDGADYAPELDPASFTNMVDNPRFPLPVGASWTYEVTTAEGSIDRLEVTVLDGTRTVMGIDTAVVRVTLISLGVAVLVGLADLALDANYMFLRRPPDEASLLDLFGPWPLYLFAGTVLAVRQQKLDGQLGLAQPAGRVEPGAQREGHVLGVQLRLLVEFGEAQQGGHPGRGSLVQPRQPVAHQRPVFVHQRYDVGHGP